MLQGSMIEPHFYERDRETNWEEIFLQEDPSIWLFQWFNKEESSYTKQQGLKSKRCKNVFTPKTSYTFGISDNYHVKWRRM